jgi:GNAT superfamily N-acetyltransferase
MKQTQFTSRIARQSDLQAVAQLCRRAVGPRDYVLEILSETIKRKGLFLAYHGDKLVGMTNFERCIDGSAWLSMARTDRTVRRRGVALFLQGQIANHARRRGISKLRMWTAYNNKPSIKAIRKGGFNQVCEAAHISQRLRSAKTTSQIRPLNHVSQIELRSLLQSRYLSDMNGYLAYQWHFVEATKPLIELLLRRREIYRVGNAEFILTKPRRIFGHLQTNLAIMNGTLTDSLRDSKSVANSLKARYVGAYIPYNRYMLRSARRLGFRSEHWGKHCLVFEKTLA